MILPRRRSELESFRTEVLDLASNPELFKGHKSWAASRSRLTNLRLY